jgi:hypothetical protein
MSVDTVRPQGIPLVGASGHIRRLNGILQSSKHLLHMLQIPTYQSDNAQANPLVLEDPDVVRHLRF